MVGGYLAKLACGYNTREEFDFYMMLRRKFGYACPADLLVQTVDARGVAVNLKSAAPGLVEEKSDAVVIALLMNAHFGGIWQVERREYPEAFGIEWHLASPAA